ncbi:MAG: hypothetical protein Q8M64_15685, partial [Methyloversatilis sp.]|nr:hypothetical protein [Methyloversatilis sp.]
PAMQGRQWIAAPTGTAPGRLSLRCAIGGMKSRPVPFAGIRPREAGPRRSDVVRFCDQAWGRLDTYGSDGDDASRVPMTQDPVASLIEGRDRPEYSSCLNFAQAVFFSNFSHQPGNDHVSNHR